MATFNGNIFGRARKSMGGITFLKTQARNGTQQAARQKVRPHDPKTQKQMSQRERMKYAVDVERLIGTKNIDPIWNRAISKLPPYQSFVSYLLKSMNYSNPKPELGSFLPTVGDGIQTEPSIRTASMFDDKTISVNLHINNLDDFDQNARIYFKAVGCKKNEQKTPSILIHQEDQTASANMLTFLTLPENSSDYGGVIFFIYIYSSTMPGNTGYTPIICKKLVYSP